MPKYTLPLSITALTLVALYVALRPQAVLVDTAVVEQGPMTVTVIDEGRWEIRELFVLSAPVSGRLQRVTVEPGDTVKAGTPLAWLMPGDPALLDARSRTQAQAAVLSAEAERQYVVAEWEQAEAVHAHALAEAIRVRETARRGRTSATELETAEFTLRSAAAAVAAAKAAIASREAQLDSARALLSLTPTELDSTEGPPRMALRAPTDGQVLRVLVESEQILAAGTGVLEFGNPAQMEVVTELLSRDATQVREGAFALLTDLGSGKRVDGEVRRVEPYGFTKLSALGVEEQRVRVHITPQAPIPGVGHGYRVDTAITVWESAQAVQVPLGALFRQDNAWSVFVARDNRARLRSVTLGHRNEAFAEVLEGLEPGEVLILHPSERITDGVRVTDQPPASG